MLVVACVVAAVLALVADAALHVAYRRGQWGERFDHDLHAYQADAEPGAARSAERPPWR